MQGVDVFERIWIETRGNKNLGDKQTKSIEMTIPHSAWISRPLYVQPAAHFI